MLFMYNKKEVFWEAANLVANNFELTEKAYQDEAQFLDRLSKTIALMLATATERLFALLYQLDVSEKKVLEACSITANVQEQGEIIAQLVWEREKQKAITRLEYKQKPQRIEEDDAEAW